MINDAEFFLEMAGLSPAQKKLKKELQEFRDELISSQKEMGKQLEDLQLWESRLKKKKEGITESDKKHLVEEFKTLMCKYSELEQKEYLLSFLECLEYGPFDDKKRRE